MQDNLEAVMSVLQFIYDNIMYAELNTKSDYCQVCGYDGEIKIVEDDGKLVWECPKCGNRDQNKLNVARRTCAVISAPSSGTRAARRRSRIACCICNPLSQRFALTAPPERGELFIWSIIYELRNHQVL